MIAEEFEKKKFTYRGKTIEELKQLGIREFAKYLNARERRSIFRNSQIIEKFVKRCKESNEKKKMIRTHLREMIIVPQLIGLAIQVYNGKEFAMVRINEEMIGHRLGEFALTRKVVKHGAPGIGATKSSAAMSVK